jgi:hypothetical protein
MFFPEGNGSKKKYKCRLIFSRYIRSLSLLSHASDDPFGKMGLLRGKKKTHNKPLFLCFGKCGGLS